MPLRDFIAWLAALVADAMRRSRKRLQRLLGGGGELERILKRGAFDATMLFAFHAEVRRSRVLAAAGLTERVLRGDEAPVALAARVCAAKRIRPGPGFHAAVLPHLLECLRATQRAAAAAAAARRCALVRFAPPEHEPLLDELWAAMQPGSPLPSRLGPHWGALGFQGADPATDFRGGGVLSLRVFVHLATRHAAAARRIAGRADLPYVGYPLALVCVAMTSWALELAAGCLLDAQLALTDADGGDRGRSLADAGDPDAASAAPLIAAAAHLVLYFDEVWWDPETRPRPASLMDYGRVEAEFRRRVLRTLRATGRLPPLLSTTAPPQLHAAGGVAPHGRPTM